MEDNQKIQMKPIKTVVPDQAITYTILFLFGIFFIMFLVLPLISILQTSFLNEGQLTFQNYIAYFSKERIRRSLYHSLPGDTGGGIVPGGRPGYLGRY